MDLFPMLQQEAQARRLEFLVIGGFAINYYGLLKDFQDLEGLILENHLDPKSEKIRDLFVKYGTLDLHEKIVRSCSNR